jgi:parallel beta-helix repeat protein
VKGAWIENCVFINCVQGTLPQYGDITGSVIQYAAMYGGIIRGNQFLNSGGPAIDTFNCIGTIIEKNYFEGGDDTPIGDGQLVNAIHSDFGMVGCIIRDNVFYYAGGIHLRGQAVETFFNDNVSTDGPVGCQIKDNIIIGTMTVAWTAEPAMAASGGTAVNNTNVPMAVRVNGGAGIVVKVDTVTQTGSGTASNQYVVPAGSTIQIGYSSAPTWDWFYAPNVLNPGILLIAGNASTAYDKVKCSENEISGNIVIDAPAGGITLYDCERNRIRDNIIRNPGDWYSPGADAFQLYDAGSGVSGAGSKNNVFSGNDVYDTRSTKRLLSVLRDNGSSNSGNVYRDGRLETCVTSHFIVTTASTFYQYHNHDPDKPREKGYEFTAQSITATVTVSATASATGTEIFNALSITADGGEVMLEFVAAHVSVTGGDFVIIDLYESTTAIGRIAVLQNSGSGVMIVPVFARHRFTPSAGAHTYKITAWRGSGNGSVVAGTGSSTTPVPVRARIVKV